MPTIRKPRHIPIESLSAPELAILTPEFLATLPKELHFPTLREARASRLYLYKILGAGRMSNIPHLQAIALSISISQAIPDDTNNPSTTATLHIYSRNDPLSSIHPQAAMLGVLTADLPTFHTPQAQAASGPRIQGIDDNTFDLTPPITSDPDQSALDLAALGFSGRPIAPE